ncbi:MAG: GMC family oxidoreductase N-terminal domain-containing protein [Acidimicrobiales bacterium]
MSDVDADVVIVGSGPGGATFADVITAAGWTAIVLEKGRNHLLDPEPPHEPLGRFSNDEIKLTRRHLLGPDPLLEPRTFRRDEADGARLLTGEVNNLPSTVGGGGVHADGKLPRLLELDLRLRSELGPVDGAAVEDWPVTYDDLEPYYAEVEAAIGVAGDAAANPFAPWRSGPYPMPPGPDMFGTRLSAPAAQRRGLHPYRAPTGVNSVPYDGRPACIDCGFCGFYGCPVHAKGDPVAMLQRALRTGRMQLRERAHVTDVLLDAAGHTATGVRYLDIEGEGHEVRSRYVVLAGGAFETPRLLLLNDLANSSGLVGHHLMFHVQTLTVGAFGLDLLGDRGRAVTHLHDDHLLPVTGAAAAEHGLPWFRGGLVEHGAAAGPILEATTYPWGPQHNEAMARSELRRRLWVFTMQGEDLPQPTNRVDLDPSVRDVWGRPAGRVTYRPHRHEEVASAHHGPVLEAVLREAGAAGLLDHLSPLGELTDLDRANPLGIAPAAPRHGDVPHGRRPPHERGRARGPLPRRREPAVRRLVGVRDVERLRAHAHAGRAGGAGCPPAHRDAAAADRAHGRRAGPPARPGLARPCRGDGPVGAP